MKTLRRARVSGSRTPWEQLCGEGISDRAGGFVLMLDRAGRLLAASTSWRERFADWWCWRDGADWRDADVRPGAEEAWEEWTAVLRRAVDGANAFQGTITLRSPTAGSVRIDCLAQPLRDAAGRSAGAIVAGKFRPRRGRRGGAAETPPVADAATWWVRAKRRRGETGFFVEDVSPEAMRLSGKSGRISVGATFPECLPLAWREPAVDLLAQAVARKGAVARRLPARDGAGDVGEILVIPAPDARFAVIVRHDDVSETRAEMLTACGENIIALEGELRRAQRLATQGMLAAAIGHEVNNCLGIALANASLFREQHGGFRAAADAIAPVIYAVQTAGRICDRFRNLGGRARSTERVVDLAEVARGAFDMLVRIVQRRLTFEATVPGPLPVRVDPTHLEQIIVNLVLNARDATRESSGRIALRVGRSQAEEGALERCWLEVDDDGVGIPASVQARLFTAYFTTKASRKGTGLGLATVQRLAEEMGGEVSLTSAVGVGTSVHIGLPSATNATRHDASTEPRAAAAV